MASTETLVVLIGLVLMASSGHANSESNSSCALDLYSGFASQASNCLCVDGEDMFGERLGVLLNCINGIVELSPEFCLTSYNSSTTNETLVGGMCPFIQLQRGDLMINPNMDYADITAESCGPANRTGTLCGRCDDGFSVAITDPWSFRCISNDECKPVNCFLYLLAELGPLTVMFVFVFMFGINAAAPYTSGYVTLAQIVPLYTLNVLAKVYRRPQPVYGIVKFLLSLYSMWSLDVFSLFIPPLCCMRNVSNMTVIALEYIGAVYPLLLVLGSYLILKLHQWNVKPIVLMTWPIRVCLQFMRIEVSSMSLLTTFCTFVSLAFVKISIISLLLLSSEDIHTESGVFVKNVVLYDGTMSTWGPEHLPHAVVAIFFLVVFLILPCLVLILYPLCNIHGRLSGRYVQYSSAFMEMFYGHFKDGTEGSRDYRLLGGMQFIFKFLLFFCILVGPTKINEQSNFTVLQIGTMLWAFLIIVLQPYKKQNHSKFEAAIMIYISITTSVGIFMNIDENDAAQYTFFTLLFLPSLVAIVTSGLVMLLPKLQQCRRCPPRKASVPMEIIRNTRSNELSELFIDDRVSMYVPVTILQENDLQLIET